MARTHNRLSSLHVSKMQTPGRYGDGGGLYLLVRRRGEAIERLWLFRYKRGGRGSESEHVLSLGPSADVPLAKARDLAKRCREALATGGDPKAAIAAPKTVPTFGEVADDYVDAIAPGLKNAKHIAQWRMTLGDTYCRSLRSKAVDTITVLDIITVLKPIWQVKHETAQRLRGRIERVLDSAAVQEYRSINERNPAVWRGNLQHLLSRRKKLTRGHHPALPWALMPDLMVRLRALNSVSALALEWTILTVARTIETIWAPRKEANRQTGVWTVPPERMKRNREHRVPLVDRCLAILDEVGQIDSPWLFPSVDPREPLSSDAMAECLKHLDEAMGVHMSVHGFRSSFRDWVDEATSFDGYVAEAALSHASGDKVEAAYRRGDALAKRRLLMVAWEHYCAGQTNAVAFPAANENTRARHLTGKS